MATLPVSPDADPRAPSVGKLTTYFGSILVHSGLMGPHNGLKILDEISAPPYDGLMRFNRFFRLTSSQMTVGSRGPTQNGSLGEAGTNDSTRSQSSRVPANLSPTGGPSR